MTISTFIFQPTLQQKTNELLVTEAETQGVLVETFKGALTLKTTTSGRQFWDELQNRFNRLARLTFQTMQIGIINNTFSGFVSGIGSIILLWFGGYLVINPAENITIGQLLAFNSMNGNFISLISTVINFVDEFTRAKTATRRLTEVIDATPEENDDGKKPFATISDNADIICTNLTFHYPGRIDLLDDFSLIIPGGKNTALIGKSGCGKSTLAKLLAGLYVPDSGNIRIGFFNIQDIALDCYRQQVVYVPQEPHFWSRTILENFRLGTPNISFEDIVEACDIADADGFISQLPNKYQTVLGEFGANLSGGQRQRLAIARGILTNPPILILDEATAGLDPMSEAHVLDRLLEHRTGKTTILITHRPSVIHRANWIVLIEKGQVQIQGTPQTFLSKPGEHLQFLTV
jgi:ABC-type bacteriocin/lantibiotic exporter with double-glycine peptidase domain